MGIDRFSDSHDLANGAADQSHVAGWMEAAASQLGNLGTHFEVYAQTGYPGRYWWNGISISVPIDALPETTQTCVNFLRENGVWFQLSRNPAAFSCVDAAAKRFRDGEVGIPLGDELKTLVFKRRGDLGYAAVNLQAEDRLDSKAIKSLIGKSSAVEPQELAEVFGAEFGTVNPILLAAAPVQIVHVWDTRASLEIPRTSMTNAGDHQLAVEFCAYQLFRSMPECIEAEVSLYN